MTARIRIRPLRGDLASEGGHREGFIVSGTDWKGHHASIFVFTIAAAAATREHLRTGVGDIAYGSPS